MKIKLHLLAAFLLFSFHVLSQTKPGDVSLLFYNVENLFDTTDNPETEDDSFTPDGDMHWTGKRLNAKLLHLSKVILNAGGWEPPAIVGLAEIENRNVLEKLIGETPLKTIGYQVIHKESPDHRGLDVAILYNPEKVYPVNYEYYPLADAKGELLPTREILYFSGVLNDTDTVHIFVNHWPSRYSGVMETREYREAAARLLRSRIDKITGSIPNPKIVVMGDFNDNPNDESICNILGAKPVADSDIVDQNLYNLSSAWMWSEPGTLKYQSQWFYFDQIMVNGALFNAKKGYYVKPENAVIADLPFLLEKDEKYTGVRPGRTYNGYRYKGGFSDHLPVLLKLELVR